MLLNLLESLGRKKILLDSKTHPGNRWAAYSLIKTYENMKKIEEKNFENK